MKYFTVQNLLSNWNAFKILKLSLSVLIVIQAFEAKDLLLGLFGTLFFGQALLNIGCCGPNGCAIPNKKSESNATQDITFTEIK